MGERIYYDIIEYARKVGEKFGEIVIPGNIDTPGMKRTGLFVMINPFMIYDVSKKASVDWKDYTYVVVLHEHLHDKFHELYPNVIITMDHIYRELVRLTNEKVARFSVDVFEDYYVDYVLLKELYPGYYEKYLSVHRKEIELHYRDIVPAVAVGVVKFLPPMDVFTYIVGLATACLMLDRISIGREVIKRNLKEYVWVYDEMIRLLRKITSSKTLVESFREYVELVKKFLTTVKS